MALGFSGVSSIEPAQDYQDAGKCFFFSER
jgi:hypothetical protein